MKLNSSNEEEENNKTKKLTKSRGIELLELMDEKTKQTTSKSINIPKKRPITSNKKESIKRAPSASKKSS